MGRRELKPFRLMNDEAHWRSLVVMRHALVDQVVWKGSSDNREVAGFGSVAGQASRPAGR